MVTGIRCPELLVASYIKPWRDCNKDEKTDVRNVLCLSPFYDALFDKHLMTVYPDMSIRYSPKLCDSMGEREYSRFIAPYDRIEVNELNRPDEKYLRIHNEGFEKNLRRGWMRGSVRVRASERESSSQMLDTTESRSRFSWHSHTTMTVQPISRSSFWLRSSLATLVENLFSQYSRLCLGVERLQWGQRCQKQPLTKIAILRPG